MVDKQTSFFSLSFKIKVYFFRYRLIFKKYRAVLKAIFILLLQKL